jgi:tetratricopeptide (TPR) repeat protein
MSKKRKRSKQPRQASKPKNYRTEKYVEYIFYAELGILQAATLLPELTDGDVLGALRKFADRIHSSGWPQLQEQPSDTDDLIAWLIVQGWEDLFRRRGRLSRRDMVGCLNTVTESAETHMRKPKGRSYLKYLEKFMKRAGVSIEMVPPEDLEDEELEEELLYNLDRMSLAELGALWLSKPEFVEAEDAFENQAHAQIVEGNGDEVMVLCRQLLKQTDDPYIRALLHTSLGTAYRHLGDLEQAVAMFQAAISPASAYMEALNQLAETYYEMGQYEQAIQTWRRCLVDPHSAAYFHRKIAHAYRQLGDLAGEEAALRDLVATSKRRGCLFLGWRVRHSLAALGQLADCLRRQGRESEWQALAARIRRSRPFIPGDHFEDWAYWTREWMLINEQDVPLARLEAYDGHEPGPVHWIPVLRAVLYEQIGRPSDAALFWRQVRREIAGLPPYAWVLTDTHNILGDLLPPSSQLFEMIEVTQAQ